MIIYNDDIKCFDDFTKECIRNINNWWLKVWKKKKSNLISHKQDIDQIWFYAKDPYWNKYQLLINKRENTDLKHLNYCKRFIVNSDGMDDIHKNIEEYNPNKKRKILTVFDDIIIDMLSDRKLNSIVTGFI